MSHIDFRQDIPKHFVRKFGWLPACEIQRQAIRKRSNKIPLRYFTFCAAEAIDVFMLERERILQRSPRTGRLESVFFCERDQEAFGIIADLIGSPDQGFQGEFEKIVLFEEDGDTTGRSFLEDETEAESTYPEEVRKKLKYKDAHLRFRQVFPFDIINLDVYGIMFPPRRGVITPLLKSLIKILEWQTEARFTENNQLCKQFTLLLTLHIHPDRTDVQAIEQLANRLISNIDNNPDFRAAFYDRYGHQEAHRLQNDNFAEFFCLALPKVIVQKALFDFGWKVKHGPIYLYSRPDSRQADEKYQMMHAVSIFERIPDPRGRLDEPNPAYYTQVATQIINNGLTWVDELVEDPQIKEQLKQDLEEIVNFRDQDR